MSEVGWSALCGLGVALLATPMAAALARRVGALDQPGGYKVHEQATPLLGGLAVATATGAGAWIALPEVPAPALAALGAWLGGSMVIVVAGVIDDLLGLSPGQKVLWQLSAAAGAGAILVALGVRLDLFLRWPAPWILALTVLWVVAITNAVNLLDNMNGLCAGLGAIAGAALALANVRSGELAVAVAAAALAGGCLGFLPFNWPRARVFLGDTGSMFIGFSLAALSVMGVYTPGAAIPVIAVLTPLFVLAVPVLDSALVLWFRLRQGHPFWLGDRRHISHRLVRRGMRPAAAVAALWCLGAASGLAALLLPTVGPAEAPLLLALVVAAHAGFAAAAGTRGL